MNTYVLDTSVIISDSEIIEHLSGNNIVIPIVVFEELENHKKKKASVRKFIRNFRDNFDSYENVEVSTQQERVFELHDHFELDTADNKILNAALSLNPVDNHTVLLTNDINLAVKAKVLGLDTREHHVKQVNHTFTETKFIETEDDVIDTIFQHGKVESPDSGIEKGEYAVLKSGKKSAMVKHTHNGNEIVRIDERGGYRIKPRNVEQKFSFDALLDPEIQLVSLTGKAGTGKTLISIAAGLEQLQMYPSVYVARPIVSLSNKDLGFLPGCVDEKIQPYMQPVFDSLGVIKSNFDLKTQMLINEFVKNGILVISPLAYIRGRSLQNVFFIIDEAQNLTPHEIKTIITRAGEGTKMIFTGDVSQIDHPSLDINNNGLAYLNRKMAGQKIFTHINLRKTERSELAELAAEVM